MTAPTTTTEAAGYLASVEHELADLPADERSELLDDLAMHLQELEEEHDDRPLEVRLGTGGHLRRRAADRRGAARRAPCHGAGRAERLSAVLSAWSQHRWVAEVRAFLPELRPAWWVLRGYLVVLLAG